MADEIKLRMAVPDWKWLVHPERWSVADILERAKIGEYTVDESRGRALFSVSSDFPYLEVEVVKPRVMISEIASGRFDFGITARDCFENSEQDDREKLDEIMDLGCSYVDLAFMTDQKRWADFEKSRKEVEARCTSTEVDDLDLFLIHNALQGKEVICGTEYRNIAEDALLQRKADLEALFFSTKNEIQYRVAEAMRDTEKRLTYSGKQRADLIFETIATGEHSSDLKVFGINRSSTARMYSQSRFRNPQTKEEGWKREKIRWVQGAMAQVLRPLEDLCQIKFNFDLILKEEFFKDFSSIISWTDPITREQGVTQYQSGADKREFILNRVVGFSELLAKLKPQEYNTTLRFRSDRLSRTNIPSTFPNSALPQVDNQDLRKIAENLWSELLGNVKKYKSSNFQEEQKLEQLFKWFNIIPRTISLFKLKSLYAYCPTLIIEEDKGYPCADVSKLRAEHYKTAHIYEFAFK